jgi:hypothetical protein
LPKAPLPKAPLLAPLPKAPLLAAPLLAALCLAALALVATGCHARKSGPPVKPAPCTAFGQTCEFSPGKLGSCVQRDNCQGPDCFICQSQH